MINFTKLEVVLNKLGLGTLIQRFKDEKVDFDTLAVASESELTRLGIVTIGDKVRLRDMCKKELSRERTSSNNLNQPYSAAIRERSVLFAPYSVHGQGSSRRRGTSSSTSSRKGAEKKRPWTVTFCLLV